MDQESSYNLEIRIISSNTRCRWFSFNKVVDADMTNFKDLVDEIVEKYPPHFREVVKVYYYCPVSKSNIEVSKDQELVAIFARQVETKCTCQLLITFLAVSHLAYQIGKMYILYPLKSHVHLQSVIHALHKLAKPHLNLPLILVKASRPLVGFRGLMTT